MTIPERRGAVRHKTGSRRCRGSGRSCDTPARLHAGSPLVILKHSREDTGTLDWCLPPCYFKNVSKFAARIWQCGIPVLLMFAVPALTPQACSIEASGRLVSAAPARQSTGATPNKPATDSLVLLANSHSERTSPRSDSPAGVLTPAGVAPLLRSSGNVAPGQAAMARSAFGASHSGRSPPQYSFL